MGRRGLISILLILILSTCKEGHKISKENIKEIAMTASFSTFIEDAWNGRNMDSLRAVSVENYIRNLNGIQVAKSQNEVEANMNIFFNGFPDSKLVVDDIVIKDNRLFAHWTFTGTNTGIFGEVAPTGKNATLSGYSNIHFNSDGKITQEDVYYNELQLLQQLGYSLIPPVVE
jgi:steroid delta-isomerase-like uncharacterized protein